MKKIFNTLICAILIVVLCLLAAKIINMHNNPRYLNDGYEEYYRKEVKDDKISELTEKDNTKDNLENSNNTSSKIAENVQNNTITKKNENKSKTNNNIKSEEIKTVTDDKKHETVVSYDKNANRKENNNIDTVNKEEPKVCSANEELDNETNTCVCKVDYEKDSNGICIKKETPAVTKNNLVSYNGWLKIKDNTLVNEKNEKIQLKGMSTHGLQWYGEYANEETIKDLKEMGSNLIRIAMYTEENGYISNRNIKEKVEKIVEIAKKEDMYVIIDWHILSDGDPLIHKEEAKEFFREMSLKYKDYPNVIYEICNEPNGNVTWENNIKPYAEEVIKEIRENSKKSIIIVGTPTWSQEVDKPANNKINDELVMYALHFYSGTHTEWLRERAKEALKEIPIFVSEWGVSDASGNGGVYKEETLKWLNFMKENNISWANWSLSNKNESSAMLIAGAPSNKISEEYLSESGIIVRDALKN